MNRWQPFKYGGDLFTGNSLKLSVDAMQNFALGVDGHVPDLLVHLLHHLTLLGLGSCDLARLCRLDSTRHELSICCHTEPLCLEPLVDFLPLNPVVLQTRLGLCEIRLIRHIQLATLTLSLGLWNVLLRCQHSTQCTRTHTRTRTYAHACTCTPTCI